MARDVKVHIEPPLRSSLGAEREATLARALARTIPSLPPGRKHMYVFDLAFGPFSSDELPRTYTATVDCTGPFGAVEQLTYVINLDVLADSTFNDETEAGSLAKIAKSMREVADGHKKSSTALRSIDQQLYQRWNVEAPNS